jgi:hypothetical protein
MNLSPNFTYAEAIVSQEAERVSIDNTPNAAILATMKNTAYRLEDVRTKLYDKPILINSWYRSIPLNRLLGSKDASQHCLGEAVDFIVPGFGTPLQVCIRLAELRDTLQFDQLILEHSWIHISFSNYRTRKQVLTLLSNRAYAPGLTDKKGHPI